MPNWASNTLTIVSENMNLLKRIKDDITIKCKGEKKGKTISVIDFNRIVPMPKTMESDWVGGEADSFRYYCLKSSKEIPEGYNRCFKPMEFTYKNDGSMYELSDYEQDECFKTKLDFMYQYGASIYINVTKYGYKGSYDWCKAKWGTKWNASEPFPFEYFGEPVDRMACTFDTAWTAPVPIAEEISRKYHVKVILYSTYEGGENPTKYVYLNGRETKYIEYGDEVDGMDKETEEN